MHFCTIALDSQLVRSSIIVHCIPLLAAVAHRDGGMAASIEPLFLPSRNQDRNHTETSEVACIFCDISFLVDKGFQSLLSHLLKEHKLVISNFTGVADPPR